MAKLSRIIAGHKAKRNGRQFENAIEARSFIQKIACLPVPQGCEWKRTVSGTKMIAKESPFDFVLSVSGKCAFIDAKSIDEMSFPFSLIKEHQLKNLMMMRSAGNVAGYLVKFKDTNVVFFKSSVLSKLNPRESLKACDGISLGFVGNFDLRLLFKDGPDGENKSQS